MLSSSTPALAILITCALVSAGAAGLAGALLAAAGAAGVAAGVASLAPAGGLLAAGLVVAVADLVPVAVVDALPGAELLAGGAVSGGTLATSAFAVIVEPPCSRL